MKQKVAWYYFFIVVFRFLKKGKVMSSKKILIVFVFLFFSYTNSAFILNEKSYQEDAQAWIETYIFNDNDGLLIPEKDLQLIANLCYFSFLRSHATLKAQQQALALLTALWNGWQNIAHTRLDPSKDTPHTITDAEKKLSIADFWTLHNQHRTIGQTYTHAVNTIVDSDILETTKALNAVTSLRSQARAVVVQALVDVRKLLGKLFHDPGKKSVSLQKGFELLNHLWADIPKLAVYSFAEADQINNKVSEDGWTILHTIQDVGCKTWKALEEARASFYLAHYNALRGVFAQAHIDASFEQILLNQEGLLEKQSGTKILPTQLI